MAWTTAGRKPKPFAFRPPKTNSFLIRQAKRLLPFALRLVPKTRAVEVSEEGLERLRKLKGERVVLTPSHSGGLEPYILFHLSKLLNEEFNYLATKEVFEGRRIRGWFTQRLGVYSIVRGTPDRSSFQMTRRLLVEGKRWLVIFPEGHTCWQNDTVMPFHQGVTQFAFWAYEDLARQGELPPLHFVPLAVKYIYLENMARQIDNTLQHFEHTLFSTATPPSLTLYERLRRVGEVVLDTNEREYNIRPAKGAKLNERVQHMKELIVSRVAAALGISQRSEQPLLDRIRDLFNAVDRITYSEAAGSEYERQLHRDRQEKARGLYDDLWRVLRFVALYDGYVREALTAERFLDVLGLLELELFGRKSIRGPRKAVLSVGEPLNLMPYYERYQRDKRTTLEEVTISLESSVRQLMAELSYITKAIEPSS
ncbi:MAG TPA: 1-acyl-sn-glycerol-3-phosphate acyltransferase [Candidatus Binatia bacterium]|nr:1-acyl-sn-glycerol-3-phosphate acyltransferase [Candidatus Binatia bacterium]